MRDPIDPNLEWVKAYPDDEWTPRGRRISTTLGVVAVLNFFVFTIVAACIGGAAANGEVVSGHYYFIEKAPGGPLHIEVTRGVYVYSYIHGASVAVSILAAIIGTGCLYLTGDYHPKRNKP